MQLITFQRKRANRRIINEDAMLALLRTYAPVQIVEFNETHSFDEQIWTLSQTGVFISVRSSPSSGLCLQPGQSDPHGWRARLGHERARL